MAITSAGQRGPKAAEEWAEEHDALIRACLAQAQDALERVPSAQIWRAGLEGVLEALIKTQVKWTAKSQAEVDELNDEHLTKLAPGSPKPGTDEWYLSLKDEARGALDPDSGHTLGEWAVKKTQRNAYLLNLTIR